MLKGIDHRLNADVLGTLRAMGHGDYLIISDTNFPADTNAQASTLGYLLRMENLTAAEAINAVLSVMPLDSFVDDFAGRMRVGDDPSDIPPVQQEVLAEIEATGETRTVADIDRVDFYDLAKGAYAVIQTGARRFYGCFMLRKGVIPPEA